MLLVLKAYGKKRSQVIPPEIPATALTRDILVWNWVSFLTII